MIAYRIRSARRLKVNGRKRESGATPRVHHRAAAFGATVVGVVPELSLVEGVRACRARRRDRVSWRRRGQRAGAQGDLSAAARRPWRVVRAGEDRSAKRRLRLCHAARRSLRVGVARASRRESHAAPVPRELSHRQTVAALAGRLDLPLHQQEERRVDARRLRLVGEASRVSAGSGGAGSLKALRIIALVVLAVAVVRLVGGPMVTRIVVSKSQRLLTAYGADGRVLRVFPAIIGRESSGTKQSEGDERTPEGEYY